MKNKHDGNDSIDKKMEEYFHNRYDMDETDDKHVVFNLPDWSEIQKRAEMLERLNEIEASISSDKEKTFTKKKGKRNIFARLALAAVLLTLGMGIVANADRLYNFVMITTQTNQSEVKVITQKEEHTEDEVLDAADDIYTKTGINSLLSSDAVYPLMEYRIVGDRSFLLYGDGLGKKIAIEQIKQSTDISMTLVNDRKYIESIQNDLMNITIDIYKETIADGKEAYSSAFIIDNVIYSITTAGITQDEYSAYLKSIFVKMTQ